MSLSLQQKRAIREQASTKNGTSEIINYYNTHVTKQKDLLTYFKEIAPNTLLVHHLVALGQVKILASLIEDNISLIVLADTEEDTPLHYAVNYGQTRAAKLLLDSDNIPRAAKKGELPLTDYVNSDGLTPIDIAGLSHDGTLIELLNNYAIRFEREKSAIERRENNPRTANIFYSYPSSSHPRQSTIHFPIPSFSLPIETPLGPNPSWRDVSCLPEYDWLSKPTGQIQWKDLSSTTYDQNVSQQRWGSGCLFTDSLFLTAGHCVAPQKGTNGGWKVIDYYTQKPLPTPALAPLMTVNFNYQLGACPLPDSVPNTDNIFEEKFNILELLNTN